MAKDISRVAGKQVMTRDEIRDALGKCKLSYEEELVIRMRHGISLEPDATLPFRSSEDEEAQIKIAIMVAEIIESLDQAAQESCPPDAMDDLKGI